MSAFSEWKNKRLESRIYLITRDSYNEINVSHELLREFMEDMKIKYKDKIKAIVCELGIEDGSVIGSGGYHFKILETLTEDL